MLSEMKHLTEQEVAQCAEAIRDGNYALLPHAIKEHLANCDSCANKVSMVVDLVDNLELDQKKSKKPLGLWLAISLSAAASITLLVVGYFYIDSLSSNSSNANPQVAISDTAKLNQPKKELIEESINSTIQDSIKEVKNNTLTIHKEVLACYQSNDELEKLTQNFTNAYRGEDVLVVSPIEILIPPSDSIRWKNPNKEEFTVEIFNNKGKSIQSIKSSTNGIKIPMLERGLYYWKLVNKEYDLLFCGKITIKE